MERRVARLSEGQRECLRMVYRHMETKEIARSLGISPDGVAQRIKTANRILGVNRRRDAARMLAEAEGIEPYPASVHPPRDIEPDPATLAASTESGRPIASSAEPMREDQAAYWAPSHARAPPLPLPLPLAGARPDDAGLWQRLAWIAGIAIGIALAFGALIAGVEALTRLVWA